MRNHKLTRNYRLLSVIFITVVLSGRPRQQCWITKNCGFTVNGKKSDNLSNCNSFLVNKCKITIEVLHNGLDRNTERHIYLSCIKVDWYFFKLWWNIVIDAYNMVWTYLIPICERESLHTQSLYRPWCTPLSISRF